MLTMIMDILTSFIESMVHLFMSFLIIPFEVFSDMLNTLFS
ncbi:hypothetical protein [Enterococcus sp. BWR-S5]|nr:hypothetical protein [Enterococcus sp. BWR-S5]